MRVAQLRTAGGAIVCARCVVASTPWSRFVGLQFRRAIAADEGMLFPHTGSIHMFFMRFAIDAVFCDADLRVVKVARDLKPWRVAGARGAKTTVELPVGGAARLEPGDQLVLA